MRGYVGAKHEFHDAEYVRAWANRFVPTAPRLQLFDLVLELITKPTVPLKHVVELGIGPGYMARYILERNDEVTYEGVDFSDAMFDIARETIGDSALYVGQQVHDRRHGGLGVGALDPPRPRR